MNQELKEMLKRLELAKSEAEKQLMNLDHQLAYHGTPPEKEQSILRDKAEYTSIVERYELFKKMVNDLPV